jgi:hypothetical protein
MVNIHYIFPTIFLAGFLLSRAWVISQAWRLLRHPLFDSLLIEWIPMLVQFSGWPAHQQIPRSYDGKDSGAQLSISDVVDFILTE